MVSEKGRRGAQRERLLAAMLEIAVQEGYPAATVARVIAHAGVSRPTFYRYFPDRQTCFLAVHRERGEELVERVRTAVAAQEPARSLHSAVAALVEYAREQPLAARLLMHETMTAGLAALDARDQVIEEISELAELARARAPADALTPELFAPTLIGAVYLLLSLRLRRGERNLTAFGLELDRWICAYERPTHEQRRRDPAAGATSAPEPSPFVAKTALYPPPPLRSGRAAPSAEQVSHNHRERIIFACVSTSCEQGYTASSVADITAAAHLDKRVFYHHFRDKQDAFQATLEYGFQQSIAVTATAFFSAPTWPQRVREALRAFTQFLVTNPGLAYFAFIDAYTIGPTAVHRFEDLRTAYTIFLQEGLQQPHPGVPTPSPEALEAIAALVFQTIQYEIRRGNTARLGSLLEHVTHLCLTPFLGISGGEGDAEGCGRETGG